MAENTSLHIEGVVNRVLYYNENNGYTVLELDNSGSLITVVGDMGGTEEGEYLLLDGEYETHPRFGTQFHVQYWEKKLPSDAINIYRWLSSGAIHGIGPSLARKIVDCFGDQTLEIMEKEPTRLLEIRGISPKKCDAIAKEVEHIFALRSLMQYLAKYDIHSRYAMRAYQKWNTLAKTLIEQNPYLLCTAGVELPFQKADSMASRCGMEAESIERVHAGILYVLQYNANTMGYTCLPLNRLKERTLSYLHIEEASFEAALHNAENEHDIAYYEKKNTPYVYLWEYYTAERYIADRIITRCQFSLENDRSDLDKIIDDLEEQVGFSYASLQRQAIITAISRGIMILTGGPGTGKTTTLQAIIALYEKMGYRVMIAAPTGRAASRLSDVTGYEASTIHRLLTVNFDMSGNMCFLHNEENPLDCDVCIVDEMSMVDVTLFESLLRALRLNCRLILVGDSDQLPSVGAGNLLHDLVSSKIVPTVVLTEIFRQAQKSCIITNAHKIIHGEYPDLTQKDNDCFFFQRLTEESVEQLILDLVQKRLPKAYNFDPKQDIQVITPPKKGRIGVEELNRCLQEALNPPQKDVPEAMSTLYTFREGDKVMQIKNNYNIVWHNSGDSGAGIYNGDIGLITSINDTVNELVVDFSGRRAIYSFDNLDQLELAYAVTVHKSQGSEFEVVILPLLDGFPKLYYRNLLYTAVTRARKLLILIGSKKVIQDMVNNNRRMDRYTCLKEMLLDTNETTSLFDEK